jgi:hypothetical protein
MARGKLSLAHGIHCCPDYFLFILPDQRFCIVRYVRVCVCLHIWVEIVYELPLQLNIFTEIGNRIQCWLDIYHWDAGLAVTGRIRDIGQNVLQSSF